MDQKTVERILPAQGNLMRTNKMNFSLTIVKKREI